MNDSDYAYDYDSNYVVLSNNATDDALYSRAGLLLPLYVLCGVFGAVGALGPLLVHCTMRRSRDRGMVQMSIVLASFCCWIFWVSVYVAQMNPLIPPDLANLTLIWFSEKYGKKLVFPG